MAHSKPKYKMLPCELKFNVQNTGSVFFTRESMKFFGDTMKNYGVRSTMINTSTRKNVEVWELFRRMPVKGGLQSSAYFDRVTFKRIHGKI